MERYGYLEEPAIKILEELHENASLDKWRILSRLPNILLETANGKGFSKALENNLDKAFIAISPEIGKFLYQQVLLRYAKNIVEFGTSFGISTIYLAAGAKETNGLVIGSELDSNKCKLANESLKSARLNDYAEIRLGDALKTFSDLPDGIDFLFLDGWKDLYLDVLQLLLPKLSPNALVIADNIFTFRKALRPYVEYMQSAESRFVSVTLPIGQGMEYSVLKSE